MATASERVVAASWEAAVAAAVAISSDVALDAAAGFVLGRDAATAGPVCSPLRMIEAIRSVASLEDCARASGAVRRVESVCTLRKIAAMRSLASVGAAGSGGVSLRAANLALSWVSTVGPRSTRALRAGSAAAAFAYPESAARALGRAAERAEWLRRPLGTPAELPGIDRAAAEALVASVLRASNDAWLTAPQVRELFEAYGIPLVPERVVATAEDAAAAARELGLPAVVKSAVPGAHKTDSGGIALDLATEDDVRAAAERIGCPVLVQPHVHGGAELLAGVVQDPVFGPLVAFGPGGVFAELIGEAQFRGG